ncbi:MAG: hypothetical protein MJ195_00880 [Mycoplasmoidaceae bacterium]|nr:hypothetical protein [Mycoplasmoidaceae bacterium]
MPRIQASKRPKLSRRELGSSVGRMFALFKGQRKVLVVTAILSVIEAILITFNTLCICVIYSNFFTGDEEAAHQLLINDW